jgi:hypothetical protein
MSRYFLTTQEATERKWKQNTNFNSTKNQHKGIELKKKSCMKKKQSHCFLLNLEKDLFFLPVGRVLWDQLR